MKAMLVRFGLWFVILFATGVWGYSLTHQWSQMIMPMAVFCVIFVFTLGAWRYNLRLIRHSTNVNQIDRFLRRRKKRPFAGYLYASVHHDYATARKLAARIPNPQQRMKSLVDIAISLRQWDEAEALLAQIDDEEYKNNISPIMALIQRDWDRFYELKANVKDGLLVLALETDEAFARGDIDKADRLGQEVIERSKGLQKYIFAKGLEISRANPNRETYF